ncbi:hypothetical protein RHSP_55853 [Rhizobium freirei PRF 81]|uniref:Uncharacterized protein n=1 Tax=Rhizobium freirei PRF 81 TaxID=363754 RepID=N6UWQ8_9HYPH|nr:hypothetical protein RHSP_55853 [Rhizobium freirei PRF 81]
MHVIDMGERHEAVERRIDGRCARIQIEGAMRQEADHAILVCNTLIDVLQAVELVLVERREAIELNGADIAAGALDPEYPNLFAGERIGFHDLGRGVAAAIVGDTLVGTEQIRPIKQLARLIEAGRICIIPTVLQKLNASRHVILP